MFLIIQIAIGIVLGFTLLEHRERIKSALGNLTVLALGLLVALVVIGICVVLPMIGYSYLSDKDRAAVQFFMAAFGFAFAFFVLSAVIKKSAFGKGVEAKYGGFGNAFIVWADAPFKPILSRIHWIFLVLVEVLLSCFLGWIYMSPIQSPAEKIIPARDIIWGAASFTYFIAFLGLTTVMSVTFRTGVEDSMTKLFVGKPNLK